MKAILVILVQNWGGGGGGKGGVGARAGVLSRGNVKVADSFGRSGGKLERRARRWRVCFSLFAGVKLRSSLLVVSIHPFLLLIEFQEFPHENDTCYLAHCYPYSYTDLELYLRTMEDNPKTAQYVQKEVLAN